MNRSGSISFDNEQIEYLIQKTGEDDPTVAIEVFVKLIIELKIDPAMTPFYINRLMEKEKA